MNLQFFTYFLPLFLYFACSGFHQERNSDKIGVEFKDRAKNKPPASFSDSIKINSIPAAVFYYPDSLQTERIKSVTDPVIFQSSMHDYFYQVRNSRNILRKYYPGIKIIDAKNARFLVFEKKGGKKQCIDLDASNDASGLFIFDGKNSPRQVDMTNIETDLGLYFSKLFRL